MHRSILNSERRIARCPDSCFKPIALPGTDSATRGESSSISPDFDFSNNSSDLSGFYVQPSSSERVPLSQCPYDTTRARECRMHWTHLLITASLFNAFQNGGNLYTSYWYRFETTHGKWFERWFNSVTEWHWDRWSDSNPFLDDYVAHSMMGGITNSLWIQDDPKGATLEFGNNQRIGAAACAPWRFRRHTASSGRWDRLVRLGLVTTATTLFPREMGSHGPMKRDGWSLLQPRSED